MCEVCATPFLARKRDINIGKARFCSPACFAAWRTRPITDRFWEKVNKDGTCWEWTSVLLDGYGIFTVSTNRKDRAHRVAYSLTYGEIPAGRNVLHHCDNPRCVRPDHLFLGTKRDNMQDMIAKGRKVVLRGKANPATRLTEDQVRAIWAMLRDGIGCLAIARQFGVSEATIYWIREGKNWGHVTAHLAPLPPGRSFVRGTGLSSVDR